MSTPLAVALVALVGIVGTLVVAWPLIGGDAGPVVDGEREAREELEAAIERSLAAIREIEMDHRAGNLSDEDFAQLDRRERAHAAELIARREA